MPGTSLVMQSDMESCTSAVLCHEAHLRREIASLREEKNQDTRRVLAKLLSASGSPRSASHVFRAMRDAVQEKVSSHDGKDSELYDVALAALDAFIAVRIRGARAKVSAFFDQLCRERVWNSLALFASSSVAEAAFLAVNDMRKRLTIIDTAPDFQGRAVAKRLATSTGVSVRYGLLSSAQRLLEGVDALVIGAEEVSMNGAVVASPGASIAVQAAREHGLPVVVATQAVKFSESIIVDWMVGPYDVLKADEVATFVTELDTGSWATASAPDVLLKFANV